jgi:hypothetical protein
MKLSNCEHIVYIGLNHLIPNSLFVSYFLTCCRCAVPSRTTLMPPSVAVFFDSSSYSCSLAAHRCQVILQESPSFTIFSSKVMSRPVLRWFGTSGQDVANRLFDSGGQTIVNRAVTLGGPLVAFRVVWLGRMVLIEIGVGGSFDLRSDGVHFDVCQLAGTGRRTNTHTSKPN